MFPYFSLILPVYNVKAYLERCIHSILTQDFQDMEIILVDDGSTDGSSEICDRFASDYDYISVIHKENGGLSSARNVGMRAAKGKYIWFIDSDDWIEAEALKRLYSICRDDEWEIVKFGHYRVEGTDKKSVNNRFTGLFKTTEQMDVLRRQALCLPGGYVLSVWSHIYKRSFLEENAIMFVSEREIGSEDYLFNLLALMYARQAAAYEWPLYNYELRNGSLSQSYKPDLPERYTRLYVCLKKHARDHEVMARYDAMIDRFYVWHLLFGTWICGEYAAMKQNHDRSDARKNVRRILRMLEFSQAVKNCDRSGLSWKQRILLLALQLKMESVLYWILAQ